jgi:hypothetical protein
MVVVIESQGKKGKKKRKDLEEKGGISKTQQGERENDAAGNEQVDQVVLYRCPARTERGRPIPALPSRTVFLRLRPSESSL